MKLMGIENYFKISVSSLFYGTDQKGNSLFLKLNHKGNDKELILFLYLSDGRVYELPGNKNNLLQFLFKVS